MTIKMSIKLYSFASRNDDDYMEVSVKEFNELTNEEKQDIRTIIVEPGDGSRLLNFTGFNNLEHLYLPDNYNIVHNNRDLNYYKKKHVHKCTDTKPVIKQIF